MPLGTVSIDTTGFLVARSAFTLADQQNGRYVNPAISFSGPAEYIQVFRTTKNTPKGSTLEVMVAPSIYHFEKDVTIDGKTTRIWMERKEIITLGGYQFWTPNEVEDAQKILGLFWDSTRTNAHLSGTI